MATRVRKWGNSLGVRIPKPVAEMLAIEEGTVLDLEVREGSLILTPKRGNRPDLDDLLAGIDRRNLHDEVDTGEPRGREAW